MLVDGYVAEASGDVSRLRAQLRMEETGTTGCHASSEQVKETQEQLASAKDGLAKLRAQQDQVRGAVWEALEPIMIRHGVVETSSGAKAAAAQSAHDHSDAKSAGYGSELKLLLPKALTIIQMTRAQATVLYGYPLLLRL